MKNEIIEHKFEIDLNITIKNAMVRGFYLMSNYNIIQLHLLKVLKKLVTNTKF